MRLVIVIVVDDNPGCSVTLSKRTSRTITNGGIVRFPQTVVNSLERFEKTIDDMDDRFGPIDLAHLGRMAASCGCASVASKNGRIDIHRADKRERTE